MVVVPGYMPLLCVEDVLKKTSSKTEIANQHMLPDINPRRAGDCVAVVVATHIGNLYIYISYPSTIANLPSGSSYGLLEDVYLHTAWRFHWVTFALVEIKQSTFFLPRSSMYTTSCYGFFLSTCSMYDNQGRSVKRLHTLCMLTDTKLPSPAGQ
jgi:hypothetical protein